MTKSGLTKFVLNQKGISALLKSSEVQADMKRRTDKIRAAAGEGFKSEVRVGRTRARGSVFTATREAMKAEADQQALTRAFGAGRG